MTIVLVRHGETALNAARVVQPADTPLSAHGQRQAALVAQRLATMNPAALMSSDMPRAWQTAQAVSAATGLAIEAQPLLQERNFGDLRGRPHAELGFDLGLLEAAPPGGESAAAFGQRASAAWESIVARRAASDGLLIVVTHGLMVRALLGLLVPEAQQIASAPPNTSITVLEAIAPHRLLLAPCARHLDAGSTNGGSTTGGIA